MKTIANAVLAAKSRWEGRWAALAALLLVLAFAIPIEHKYDKLFRFFSLALIPQGVEIPPIFEKKIYFYASDLIALCLFALALFGFRTSLRRLLFEKTALCLWIVFLCSLGSLLASPLSHYPVLYTRLLHLLTPVLLFSVLASALAEEPSRASALTRLVLGTIVLAGCFQTAIAIAQYFEQSALGLRWLGEQKLGPSFAVQNGSRWIFDALFHRVSSATCVLRAAGTFPHPNVLGGFLALSLLATYSLVANAAKPWRLAIGLTLPFQFFALCASYSRSGLFAWALGTGIWFLYLACKKGAKKIFRDPAIRFLALMIFVSGSISFLLLHDQFRHRGGIVNYNTFAQECDQVRIHYQNIAFQMIEKHPCLGVGFQQFSLRYPEFLPPGADANFYLTAAHNIYLLLGAETGLISLAAFLFFIALILRSAWRSSASPEAASLLGAFIGFLFIGGCDFYPLLFQQGKLMLFLVASLLAVQPKKAY